jgi:iron complex outermembrane receptor protein
MKSPSHIGKRMTAAAASVAILAGLATSVNAQNIEEIIVTAQKREQNLQKVPIAITAMTAETIEARAINNVSQIGDYTPNVFMDYTSPFSGSTNVLSPTIRGIGQNDFAFNLEPGVGVYVDGVYYARTLGAVVDLLDLDRIEVLKGPQGTLFGRNTIGGAIAVYTRRPAEEFAYRAEVTTGRFNRLDVRGSIDVPLVEGKVYSQVSFSVKTRDGYQKRIPFPATGPFINDTGNFVTALKKNPNESGNEDNKNLRAKLLFTPTDRVDVTLAFDYTDADEQATPATLLRTFPDAADGSLVSIYNACLALPQVVLANIGLEAACGPRGTALGPGKILEPLFGPDPLVARNFDADPSNDRLFYNDQFITDDIDVSYATGSNFSILESWGAAGTIDFRVNDQLLIKSITAYRELSSLFGMDFDGSPIMAGDTSFDQNQEQFSQELQVSGTALGNRMDWVLGGYFFHEEGDLTDFVPFAEGIVQVFGLNLFDNDAFAFFTHLHFDVTEKLGLTVGLRYTDENKTFEGRQRDLNSFPSKVGFPAFLHPDPNDLTRIYPLGVNKKSFTNTSARFGIDYDVNENIFTYLSFSQGFKSGGWTTRLLVPEVKIVNGAPVTGDAPGFDEEKADAWEIGIKSRFLDNRVQINVAAFYTDYTNIQITVQRGISPTFENGGEGEVTGFEGEFQAYLTNNFVLTGSVGILDAKYTKLPVETLLTLQDKFVNTPDFSSYLGGDYTIPLNGKGSLSLHADYTHNSRVENDNVNNPLFSQPSVDLVNVSAVYEAPSRRWQLVLGGRNITDERYVVSAFENGAGGAGITSATYSRPSEWFLTFRLVSK